MNFELIDMLRGARALSQWGPDFSDPRVTEGWDKKLDGIPIESIQKALDRLSGNKEFPTPNELKAAAQGEMRHKTMIKKGPLTDHEQAKQDLLRQIVSHETLRSLKERHKFHYLWVTGDIVNKSYMPYRPKGSDADLAILTRWLRDIPAMLREIDPNFFKCEECQWS